MTGTQSGRRRVLLVIAGLGPGGAERQMALLARELDRDRHDVGLLIFNAEERVHYQDVFERPLWFRALGLSRGRAGPAALALGMALGIRRAVADFKPDLIHASLHVANVAARATGLLCFPRTPVVTSIRCNFLRHYPRADQLAERLLCRRSAAIIVNAEAVRRQLLESLPLNADRVATVANGVDPRFRPGHAPAPTDWPAGGRAALAIGRLSPEKNHLAMIEALKALEAQGRLGDWNFALVGEGPLRERLEEAAAGFPRLRLLPPAADPLPLYRNADLLLLPSLHEGMPNVALEAQACGVPAALTPAANAGGAVAAGCGWLLEGGLAEALAGVLAQPADELRRRGALARADVLARFGAARMARETEAVYAACLEARRGR